MSYNSKYKGAEVDAALDLANTALQEHQDISGLATKDELETKVDKVDGKQLTTEDFTTTLKEKLDGLSNYDDTTISEAVEKLRTDFDTLVSGDTAAAIESFNEIIAFLDGIEDSESLDSIIASIEQQIAAKGTVTSITAGDGLTGGTITGSGTIALENLGSSWTEDILYTHHAKVIGNDESETNMTVDLIGVSGHRIMIDTYGRFEGRQIIDGGIRRTTFLEATNTLNGLMSATDKTKLDGIDMTTKQDTLVSGTNIKTINGTSILGSGDITIEGGSGTSGDYLPLTGGTINGDLIIAKGDSGFGNLSVAAEIDADLFRGRWSPRGGKYELYGSSSGFEIRNISYDERAGDLIFNGDGTKFLANDGTYKTIETGGTSSGSAAYPLVEHGTSDTTFTLTPNTFHVWDEVASLDLSFGDETSGVANEFLFQFTSGATATTLTLPDDIKWANDTAPTIAENMIYQVSVLRGLASVLEFSNAAELIENAATISNGMLTCTVSFAYPVASDLTVSVRSDDGPKTSTIASGQESVTISLGGPSEAYIESILPSADNVYLYTF